MRRTKNWQYPWAVAWSRLHGEIHHMQTILVTGGAGFIGGCFVRQLLAEQNTRVINLDKLTYAGNLDSLATVIDDPLHIFVPGSIGDYKLVLRLLQTYHPTAIVNFAAESH